MCGDPFQKNPLNIVQERHGDKSSFYRFDHALPFYPKHADLLEKTGLCAFIRTNKWSMKLLKRYFNPENSLLIYSLWEGYLREGTSKNDAYCTLMQQYTPNALLHTSGHATGEALAALYDMVKPTQGTIPMHSEKPEQLRALLPNANVIMLDDGETLEFD